MLFLDKKGEHFEVRLGREGDADRLLEMYEAFHPKGKFQGLPPLKTAPCLAWIRHLFNIGENHLAFRQNQTIGHAVLLPDLTLRDAEYLVFVSQNHRGLGVGTQLTRQVLDQARRLDLTVVWLTVDASNFIAIRLYRKFGFCFSDAACVSGERKMSLDLGGNDDSC